MANDRADFEPEFRNQYWWATDSAEAAKGNANDVVLTKIGAKPPKDLSHIEAVQMGHVMQPIIGRLAQDRLKVELKDADYMMTHPKESWMRSHFDFISADGKMLVEAKNYSAMTRNKYDAESGIIPAFNMAQLIHQSACHNIEHLVLAVLFGGQEFQVFQFHITEQMRDQLVKDMAKFWAAVQTKTPLDPETTEHTKLMYKADAGTVTVANAQVVQIAEALKVIKSQIKQMEEDEDKLQTALQSYMQNHAELVGVDGSVLATWRSSKASKRFNAEVFKSAMPDIYEQFVFETPGSRRFLLK